MYSKKKATFSFHSPLFFLFPCLLLTFYCLLANSNSFAEVIDRIVAVVNGQVITLADLKIAEAFGLYERESESVDGNPLFLILERIMSQKIVIDAARKNISIEEDELEAALNQVAEEIGSEEFQKRLEEFGFDSEGLKDYLEEKILCQKILSLRFGQGVSVNLEEIETYYKKTYVPSQEKKGLKPRPMMEILDEIELTIKQEKIKTQIADWIDNLRKQAEIEIKFNDFESIKNK